MNLTITVQKFSKCLKNGLACLRIGNFHKTSRSTFALALFWSNKVSAFVCISSFERASCVYGVLTPGMSGSPPDSSNLTLPVLLLLLKSRSFQANVKRHCVGSEFPNSTQLNFIRKYNTQETSSQVNKLLENLGSCSRHVRPLRTLCAFPRKVTFKTEQR